MALMGGGLNPLVQNAHILRKFQGHTARVNTIVVTGREKLVSGSSDGSILVFDMQVGGLSALEETIS